MAGFKSFADKIDVEFDTGITAIVGPNGCGKSNVADAIRWVLGEQSVKLLRGAQMQDVIFSGTESRKSLSYCEVSLIFDNADHALDIGYDEVVISRKLYRSGESEYLLNRAPCRLKDIINVLYDSGIGRDGYSIIGQGKVEEIISAKPENRRTIFEDAAGISKFKSRKLEAERKLERTNENLVRLNDITTEIERQLSPLKEQAETAKKYLEYKQQLRHHEINSYIAEYDSASENKQKINAKIEAILQEISIKQSTFDETVKKYEENLNAINTVDKKITSVHEEVLNYTVSLEKFKGEARLIEEKINHLKQENNKLNFEIDEYNNKHKELQIEQAEKEQILKNKSELLNELSNKYDSSNSEYQKLTLELMQNQTVAKSNQKAAFEVYDKLSDVKSEFSRLNAEKQALSDKQKDSNGKLITLKNRLNESKKREEDLRVQAQDKTDKKQELKTQADLLTSKYNEYAVKLKEAEEDLSALNSKYHSYDSKFRLMSDMQAEYEGYSYTVKKLLQDSAYNEQLKLQIVGVIANLMSVPQKFETAIEMALGQAVQNIVTKNEDDAKAIIEYLKEKNYGRLTLLPITSIKPRSLPVSEREINVPDCFGVASDVIKYDYSLDGIFKGLLGSTVITGNMETAINLAKKHRYAYRIVTLDGDIINPTGSMTGGSKKPESTNLLSREREIQTIQIEIEKISEQIKQKQTVKLTFMREQEEISIRIKDFSEQIRQIELQNAKEDEKFEKAQMETEDFRYQIAELEDELGLIKQQFNDINNQINTVEQMQNMVVTSKGTASKSISDSEQQYMNLQIKSENLNNIITDYKVKIAACDAEIESLLADLERIKRESTIALVKISEDTAEIKKNEKTISAAESLSESTNVESGLSYSEITEKLEKLKADLTNFDEYKEKLNANLRSVEENRMAISNELTRAQEKKYQEEMALNKIDTDIDAMQTRIWEEYELTYTLALEFRQADYELKKGLNEINKLKREINKLGYVNVNAIEDFRLLNERYEDMIKQINDLTKAQEDLMKIINDMAKEMLSRFDTEFEKINRNFTKVFSELFGGGNAKLVLTESEDPLLAGVEIVAEPPGKKLQSITLLSGGEKALTAIAILFAILKMRPMPFCVLDEIEAALDDANVERFAKYLRRFAETTQFIVITHRKPTMELADSLYGVTMQEKGVSKIISVKLSEAVKNNVPVAQ
jgi:chromosome segregation protein